MARNRLDEEIVKLVRTEKTIGLAEAREALVKLDLGTAETIRKRIAYLDGIALKKVRRGREYHLVDLEFYRRQSAITLEMRVAHTHRLKPLLEKFIGEIPVIDDRSVQPARDGVAPRVIGAVPERYDPEGLLESEKDGLFADLLFHLDLLEPSSKPAMSSRVDEFKAQVRRLQLAQDQLWNVCKAWTAKRLGLSFSEIWTDNGFSDTVPRYLYDHALAAHRQDENKTEFLSADRELLVTSGPGRFDVGWGAEGLFQQRVASGLSEEGLKRKTKRMLDALPETGASPTMVALATKVDEELKIAFQMRASLLVKLRDALVFEAFEGACKYVLPAQ